jgi:K+-sensing histidine kinase KdpD
MEPESPAAIATISQVASFPEENENRHAVRLARNLRSALTTATALIAISVDRHFLAVPDPAPLFVCVVAFAASLGGPGSGMISAAIAVAASALFFLNHRATSSYDLPDLVRLAMLAITATGTAVITGLLRKKLTDAFASR